MKSHRWALILASLILSQSGAAFAATAEKPDKLVSVTVAQVGTHVITSRDVQMVSILDHWFLLNAAITPSKKQKPVDRKDWIPVRKSEAFNKQLSLVVMEHLVVTEAENFSVARISADEVAKYAHDIQEDLKSWPEWHSLEVSQVELENQVQRHLRAKEFLKFKTESMGFQISDDEAKAYYEQNRLRFNNLPYENFRDSIKEYLARRDVESKMKDWFDVLRKKYKVKLLQYENSK